jgi:hypothetical protein
MPPDTILVVAAVFLLFSAIAPILVNVTIIAGEPQRGD